MPLLPTQNTQDPHTCLPLFLDTQLTSVPPSTSSSAQPSLLPLEGSPAIVTFSSGNFENSFGHLLHDCSETLSHTITQPNHSHENLNAPFAHLQLSSHDSSTDLNLGSTHNPTNPNFLILPKIPHPPQRTHTMTTRSMNQIFKPKQINTVSKYRLPQTIEPTSVSQAISEPHWREVMSNELTALMKHGTWDLVLSPSNCKPVGCK
jgi:hypothetical protein